MGVMLEVVLFNCAQCSALMVTLNAMAVSMPTETLETPKPKAWVQVGTRHRHRSIRKRAVTHAHAPFKPSTVAPLYTSCGNVRTVQPHPPRCFRVDL